MSNFYCKKCGAENYKDSILHYNTCKCNKPDPKPKIHEECMKLLSKCLITLYHHHGWD